MSYLNLFSADTWYQIYIVFAVAFYLLECYMGYRLIKGFSAVVGFILGFVIAFSIAAGMYTSDAYIPAIIGICAGIGLALVAFKLYLVGVFIYCGAVASSAVLRLPLSQTGSTGVLLIVLCIAAFVVVGILAVKFSRMCIIAVTSVTGAINAANLLREPLVLIDTNVVLRIAVIALIAVTGILVQRLTTK